LIWIGKALNYVKSKPNFFRGDIAVDEPVLTPSTNVVELRGDATQTEVLPNIKQ
jgi:hypothetical protein